METENKPELTTGRGQGLRYNQGKLRYDLVEPHAHRDMVEVLTDGAIKYKPKNWTNGMAWSSVIASLKRHITAFELGEDYDPESNRLHLAHAACNIHFLNAFYYIFPQGDDRDRTCYKNFKIGLDIDDVIIDFIPYYCNWFNIATPKFWHFDYNIKQNLESVKNNKDFWLNMPAKIKPEDLKFEPELYITNRIIPSEWTKEWIQKHEFPTVDVITVDNSNDKIKIAKERNLDIFIDDKFQTFLDMNNAGICCFLMDAVHNQKYDVGHKRIKNINDILILK